MRLRGEGLQILCRRRARVPAGILPSSSRRRGAKFLLRPRGIATSLLVGIQCALRTLCRAVLLDLCVPDGHWRSGLLGLQHAAFGRVRGGQLVQVLLGHVAPRCCHRGLRHRRCLRGRRCEGEGIWVALAERIRSGCLGARTTSAAATPPLHRRARLRLRHTGRTARGRGCHLRVAELVRGLAVPRGARALAPGIGARHALDAEELLGLWRARFHLPVEWPDAKPPCH
mmetsp:Transcript_128377/g.411471  ORF Transcript_128377/g.411471 Transcript_128377/m.411471 type:complete len:228 (-) Transcript_128377:71-754(-)